MKTNYFKSGMIIINVLVFAAIAVTVTIALVNWGAQTIRTVRTLTNREQAFQVAEAGIEYYRWHLAHFASDYTDGTTTPQPYVHVFEDAQGQTIGQFSLTITPPTVGSTLVTVKSTGTLLVDPSISRTIQATLGKPSFAKYAFVANDFMRFGAGTVVNGPIQSNNGVHFDGVANNIVTSALATTTEPDSGDCHSVGALEWAVFTQYSSSTPCTSGTYDSQPYNPSFVNLPNRSDVFTVGRQTSVPNVSFSGITANLSTLQGLAGSVGAPNYTNLSAVGSGYYGYHIVFNYSAGTTTYNLYKVSALSSAPSGCGDSTTGWGTWSIKTETPYPSSGNNTFHLSANGVIFVAGNVWVNGTVGNNARITIAAGILPDPYPTNPRPNIIVNNDLKYTNKDGTEVIGLIAQGNVTVGLYSGDNLEIDAAIVAQNGRVGRFSYGTSCESSSSGNEWRRSTITVYGMIATFVRYGFSWKGSNNYNCGGSIGYIDNGYCNRNVIYDPNLLYGPPPSFPLSSSQYVPLTWQEVN